MNRRDVLRGTGVVGAAVVVPVGGSALVRASDRAAWTTAYARFQAVNAEYDRRIAAEEKAGEAVDAACPRIDRYFDEYNLGFGMSRETALGNAEYSVAARAADAAGAGDPMTDAQIKALYKECPRVVDEFMAYQERHEEACRLYGLKALQEQVTAYRATYFEARDALMAVPAPDADALLVKMEIASTWLDDPYAESAFDDARRLLGAGRA